MLEALLSGFAQVLTVPTFPLMLIGILVGFVVGILPGLGGGVALALMLPFTFDMEPVGAFAFLLGMLAVTATTGDITSILFGVPGEATSAALVLDGHPMSKNGEAGRALGAALMSSLVGAIFSALVLAASIPIIRPVVLAFSSPEFFALAVLGVVFVGSLSAQNRLKGVLAGGVGLLLSTVGLDPQSGAERYTFGLLPLWDGVSLIAVVVGLFGFPEIVSMAVRGSSTAERPIGKLGGVWQGVKDTFVYWPLTLRCSALGTFIGLIPGLGGAVSQWVAYGHAVQSSRDKSRFGKGDVRGVLGPGAANNGKESGSLIPTIAFGIPGSVSMSILLGAFLIQGLVPGEAMLTTHVSLTFSFVWIIIISNIITVGVCFLFLNQIARIAQIRNSLLIPVLLLLVFFGSYAESSSVFNMGVALVFGLIGVVMVECDWPRPPLILGLVLGTLMERYLFISYSRYGSDFLLRPVVMIIIGGAIVLLLLPGLRQMIARRLHIKEENVINDPS